jgi:hypothetical protein
MTDNKQVEQIAVSLLKQIYDGYCRFQKHELIPDSTCTTCNGFLYVCRGGVPDVDCPSCGGTGMEREAGLDCEGFAEFIEHGIIFGNTPFLEIIREVEPSPIELENVQESDTTGSEQSGEAGSPKEIQAFMKVRDVLESQLREARKEIEEYSRNLKNAVNTGEHWCNKWAEVNAKNYDLEEQLKNLSQQAQELETFKDKIFELCWNNTDDLGQIIYEIQCLCTRGESTPQTPNKQNG